MIRSLGHIRSIFELSIRCKHCGRATEFGSGAAARGEFKRRHLHKHTDKMSSWTREYHKERGRLK